MPIIMKRRNVPFIKKIEKNEPNSYTSNNYDEDYDENNHSLSLFWNFSYPEHKVKCEGEYKYKKASLFFSPTFIPYLEDKYEVDFGTRYSVFGQNTFTGLNLRSKCTNNSAQLAIGHNFDSRGCRLRLQGGVETDISHEGVKNTRPFFEIAMGIGGRLL